MKFSPIFPNLITRGAPSLPRICSHRNTGKARTSFSRAILLFSLAVVTLSIHAQTAPPATQPEPHNGKVIFSRSIDENGQTTDSAPSASAAPKAQLAPPQVAEGELLPPPVAFTAFDLDVRLQSQTEQIAVRALLTLRNDGKSPLTSIPLQISSSLNWERIRVIAADGQSRDAVFQLAKLNSDADHTGQLNEALVQLTQPLNPGATLQLDATYSGQIAPSAQRLISIGAPESAAQHSDWDQISVPFTGLRGFGNVVWYPVVSAPVLLGDGARLFDAIGEHKLHLSGTRFRLRLTVEFPHGRAPTVTVVNGHSLPLSITESGALDQSQEVSSVATADSGDTTLGFQTPSLFVAIRTPHPGPSLTAFTIPEDNVAVEFWTVAASAVTPFLQGWLGQQPRSPLTLLDLPDPDDAPFETGTLLATPLREAKPDAPQNQLTGILVHALAHSWVTPPNSQQPAPSWLDEGLAAFMGALWTEKQQGHDAALRTLESGRAALALAEPASPGQSPGQPLAQATSPVYYRTKAAYVLWMLRDLAGDSALSAALKASNPASFVKLLEATEAHPDLSWFFADWVNADKGLPDITIDGVFPTSASADNWLVAVNLSNTGYASAEIPVTVRSDSSSVTHRIRIPARGKLTERILIQGKPTEVQANDGTVLETQASIHITRLDNSTASPSSSSQPNPPQP
jgi:hypothetical protein